MDYRQKQQSYHSQRTGILVTSKQYTRKKSPKMTYSKAIHPLNLHIKAMSQKNIDLMSYISSESSRQSLFEDNQSCCCFDCSKPNKKIKSLQKKFGLFRTHMSIIKQQRLQIRFKNAVYCILYIIQRMRKQRLLEKQKKMLRYKTKVFLEGSPLFPSQQQRQIDMHDEKHSINIHSQSIQAKIIDQRHKQRQSVRLYLQQKLQDKDSQITLPKIQKCNQSSFSNIQPSKFQKAEEQKSPRYSTQLKLSQHTENSPRNIQQHSPYLNHQTSRNFAETIIQSSFSKTPRTVKKSISSELLTQKHQFHLRKNTAATLKGLI